MGEGSISGENTENKKAPLRGFSMINIE